MFIAHVFDYIIVAFIQIALAERRRELEKAGQSVDESLKDVSGGIVSKSNSKRALLENEVVTLAQKLEEMEVSVAPVEFAILNH